MIDLHVHSTESDGSLTPQQLVSEAAALGLEALAIADHDTMAGYEPALRAAAGTGVELICAVEISARRECLDGRSRGVHLLAYFFQGPPGEGFSRWLEQQQQRRRERNQRLAARLQELGLEVALEEVAALGGKLVGRVHFAQALIRRGYAASVQEAFREYLGQGGRAYLPMERVTVEEAIRKIRDAGGLACVAHPGRLRFNLEGVLGEWRAQGLGGLEVFHSEHSREQTGYLLALARRFELAVTGGSDFHGEGKPGVCMGTGMNGNLSLNRELLEALRQAAKGRGAQSELRGLPR